MENVIKVKMFQKSFNETIEQIIPAEIIIAEEFAKENIGFIIQEPYRSVYIETLEKKQKELNEFFNEKINFLKDLKD